MSPCRFVLLTFTPLLLRHFFLCCRQVLSDGGSHCVSEACARPRRQGMQNQNHDRRTHQRRRSDELQISSKPCMQATAKNSRSTPLPPLPLPPSSRRHSAGLVEGWHHGFHSRWQSAPRQPGDCALHGAHGDGTEGKIDRGCQQQSNNKNEQASEAATPQLHMLILLFLFLLVLLAGIA